jgi:hypothetical protein
MMRRLFNRMEHCGGDEIVGYAILQVGEFFLEFATVGHKKTSDIPDYILQSTAKTRKLLECRPSIRRMGWAFSKRSWRCARGEGLRDIQTFEEEEVGSQEEGKGWWRKKKIKRLRRGFRLLDMISDDFGGGCWLHWRVMDSLNCHVEDWGVEEGVWRLGRGFNEGDDGLSIVIAGI